MQQKETAKDPVILDLGRQKKKRVNRLRKGHGRLMDDIDHALADLKEEGVIGDDAQPIIVVVRRKKKKNSFFM